MAVTNVDDIQNYLSMVTCLKNLPKRDFQIDYDSEADVMYISFGDKVKPAADNEHTDDDLIIRYDDQDEIIGLTILHASQR